MAQGMNGAWLALGVAGAVAAAGAVAGRGQGSRATTGERRHMIAELPVKGDPENVLEVEVYYSKAYKDLFTEREYASGFYIGGGLVRTRMEGDTKVTSFTGYSGIKHLLMPATRYSDKGMREAVEKGRAIMPKLVAAVCKKNGVEVESGSMARGKAVPLRQRIYELEDEEGTFTARLETMYPGFFEGVEEADPNVLRLRKGASTYVGGGAAPRTLVKRMR